MKSTDGNFEKVKNERSFLCWPNCGNRERSIFPLWLLFIFLVIGETSASHRNHESNRAICSGMPDLAKYDCHPDSPAEKKNCLLRGCCWQVVARKKANYFSSNDPPPLNVPSCYFPKNYMGYRVVTITSSPKGQTAILQRFKPSGFPNDVKNLNLVITYINNNSIRIKITDHDSKRFEVPLSKREYMGHITDNSFLYNVNLDYHGHLTVTRKSTGVVLFRTNLSVLVYSDQFLQLSTRLPSPTVYGLGEQNDHLLRSVNWSRTTLFNKGIFPAVTLYGTHPFYLSVENGGNTHGVLFLNSNAMDIILQPTPALTYRTIGGILDIYVFLGPSPDQVVQQYTHVAGSTFMPPYWSLGFHLCRYNYNSSAKTMETWKRTIDAGIPFDVQWNDIDYMERHNDFTYDKVKFKGLPEFVNKVHDKGMRYVIILDPGVSNTEKPGTYPPYDEGLKHDIFVKNANGGIFVGKVWNDNSTVFPDFSHPAIERYWRKLFRNFHREISFDGGWIDMNEPYNFLDGQINGCPQDSSLEYPPYLPGGGEPLHTQTVCMTAKHYSAPHYDEHSLYSYREAIATFSALYHTTGKRPFIISRASITGQGAFTGHWSGDIRSNWEDLRYSVICLMNFNFFGIPMMGSDICGFAGNTTVELCARWSAVGAFYPFSRNHNDKDTIEQDPVALGPVVVKAAKKSLLKRYYLLPYLYTLFYRSHAFGETVVRPLFFEYPRDVATYDIEEYFLWGPALMIIPVLYPGESSVTAYFPRDLWYNFNTGERINSCGQSFNLYTPITEINLFIRCGFILPLQIPNTTTTTSRCNPFDLFVALNNEMEATGELYWDDGETHKAYDHKQYNLIKFFVEKNTLTTLLVNNGYFTSMPLNIIKICGLQFEPRVVIVNGNLGSYNYNKIYDRLEVDVQGLSLVNYNSISWE